MQKILWVTKYLIKLADPQDRFCTKTIIDLLWLSIISDCHSLSEIELVIQFGINYHRDFVIVNFVW